MASIQKNNKFQKLRLCPWSFAQGQKEKVNKKMEEKGEKEKKEKEKEKGKEPEWDGSLSQEEATALETFINRENDKMKQVDERIKMEQEDKMTKAYAKTKADEATADVKAKSDAKAAAEWALMHELFGCHSDSEEL